MNIVTTEQFAQALRRKLDECGLNRDTVRAVCGPGRSGALAAVYTSHMLGVPFVPYDRPCPEHLRPLLIIDTATSTGRTLRKAERKHGPDSVAVAVFHEPPRVHFWYEAQAMGKAACHPPPPPAIPPDQDHAPPDVRHRVPTPVRHLPG